MIARPSLRQRLSDLLLLDTFGLPESQVKTAINRSLMHYLPFMYITVAVFFLIYALLQIFLLQETGSSTMVTVALVSAAFMFLGGIILRWGVVSPGLAEFLTAVGAMLVFLSIILRAQLTEDPKQIANLALFLFAIAVLFVSPLWYGLFAILTLGALVLAMVSFTPQADWPYFFVITVAAMATGFLAHVVRVRAYRHSVVLRMVEENQRRELQRRAVQIQTAVGVGQRITSFLDQDQLLQQIVTLIWQKYRVYYVGVFLPDENGTVLTAVAQAGRGVTDTMPPLRAGYGGLIGCVMRHGEALCVDNVLQDGRFDHNEATPATQSELVLPLKMGDRILGALDLQSDRSVGFNHDEIPALQLLADQVATSLENARLYAEVRQLNQELEKKVAKRTKALQEAYSRLERLDRTKTDFITIASHELRTPLTIVNFNSQMFLEDETIRQNNEYLRWAEGIHRGVMRMEGVVENILDVAKIDSRSLELYLSPLNIRFLIHQVVRQLEQELGDRDLIFTVADMPDLPDIEADAEAMEKMFYHLLVNAIKFTPDGGFVKIDGRFHQRQNGKGPAGEVELIVADTGVGITPEIQDLIFEKFFQTGDVKLHSSGKTSFQGGGSGIGLAIVKGIVEAHNGRVWVESPGFDEDECPGTAFHVMLPVTQAKEALNDSLVNSAPQPS